MKSKYAELFTAKLNDMDLVLFEKHKDWDKWALAVNSDRCFMVSNNFEYFLCLPEHNDSGQCLHWLNGGEIEVSCDNSSWEPYDLSPEHPKYPMTDFTGFEFQFRIKPKKEKRLLAINGDQVSFANSLLCYPQETQFIEIEVEI